MLSIITRLWSIALAVAISALSAWLFFMSAQASALPSPVVFDSHRPDQRQAAYSAIDQGQDLFANGSCLNPAREDLVNLMIAALTLENPAKDYGHWSQLTTRLRSGLQSNIICDPATAQNWSRLALLDLIQSYDDVGARTHLEASYLLSPVLYDSLAQRLTYWSRTEAWKSGRPTRLSGSDIATLVRYAKPEDVAAWAERGVPQFQISIREEVAKVTDPARRSEIKARLIEAPLRGPVDPAQQSEQQGDR